MVTLVVITRVREKDLEPVIELAMARFRQIERLERTAMRLRTTQQVRTTVTSETAHLSPSEAQEQMQPWIGLGKVA